ncbi:MAG: heavy metal translocating P-type ATPase [Oscillospiraceae bacterium]|nr:heavy metal translocating P-type ATPase [Oscillospiraceae bacterium]
MTQYNVTGMSCAACSARVEKAVSAVPGVESCAVSLLTNSMGVEGSAAPEAVIAAVTGAGYGASVKGAEGSKAAAAPDDALVDTETPKLLRRLIVSAAFLLVLMYVSMGHMMWGWPLPKFLDGNHVAMGLTELLLAAIVMVINQRFFISGFRALAHRAPNMDTLVSLGSAASFVWSVAALFAMTGAQLRGDAAAVMDWMEQFYFESAAMILTLITVGKTLEARSKGKTTDALKSLMKLAPETATVVRDGAERVVPVAEVRLGEVFVLRPGECVPVDGTVLEGGGAVDESALTGESIPVDKAPGDGVSAGTVNQSGFLRCVSTRVGEDTTLRQIIRLVSDAAATKAPIARIADKVSGVFVPVVIGIALVTFIVWLLLGRETGWALARGISVLVISCPCALGLATPVAIMVGSGVGARNGVLFKTAAGLEQAGKIRLIALDKTGTITEGQPRVTDVLPAAGVSEQELLRAALALETPSEHPLAKAVVNYCKERGMSAEAVTEFRALTGSGVTAKWQDRELLGGNAKTASEHASLEKTILDRADALSGEGKTPLFFLRDGRLLGLIAVADTLKADSAEAIRELKALGLTVVMLTGDNERTAQAIGRAAGVDRVIAGVLPEGKEAVIRELSKEGAVCMVGDGVNDAPALTRADLGMAIGAGTDVAIDAADVVLMRSSLRDVALAIRLSRATLRNIHQNLFWAFFYNVIGIPIAAGALIPLGITLSPMLGAAAMSLSSFCVVTNALRLNLFRVKNKTENEQTVQNIQTEKEENNMSCKLSIEGMMCPHCEAHVKNALNAVPGVEVLQISHQTNSAEIKRAADVTDEALSEAVKNAGYTLTGVN